MKVPSVQIFCRGSSSSNGNYGILEWVPIKKVLESTMSTVTLHGRAGCCLKVLVQRI